MVERRTGPKSLMERSKGCQELDCCLAICVMCVESIHPHSGVPYPPFYRPRGRRGYRWEKEEKPKVEKVLRGSQVFFFPCAYPTNMADRVRDGVFADPYRAVPWPLSTSGCLPSYTSGWCGVLESRAMTLQGVDGEVTPRPSL